MGTSVIGAIVANIKANTVGFTSGVETARKEARRFHTDLNSMGGVSLSGLNASMMNIRSTMRFMNLGLDAGRLAVALLNDETDRFTKIVYSLPMGIGEAAKSLDALVGEVTGYTKAMEGAEVQKKKMQGARDVGAGLMQKTELVGLDGFQKERATLKRQMQDIEWATKESAWASLQARNYAAAMTADIDRREEEAMKAAADKRLWGQAEGARQLFEAAQADEKALAEMQWQIWSDAEDYGIALQEAAFQEQMHQAAAEDAEVKDLLKRRSGILAHPEGRLNVGMGALVTDRMQRAALTGDSARTLSQEQLTELRQINTRLDKLLTATEEAAGLG